MKDILVETARLLMKEKMKVTQTGKKRYINDTVWIGIINFIKISMSPRQIKFNIELEQIITNLYGYTKDSK